jgi:hypothetical protein
MRESDDACNRSLGRTAASGHGLPCQVRRLSDGFTSVSRPAAASYPGRAKRLCPSYDSVPHSELSSSNAMPRTTAA